MSDDLAQAADWLTVAQLNRAGGMDTFAVLLSTCGLLGSESQREKGGTAPCGLTDRLLSLTVWKNLSRSFSILIERAHQISLATALMTIRRNSRWLFQHAWFYSAVNSVATLTILMGME
ncbi:hypothetical protein [Hartmannibacter diazotrophicus]|uniref:hypothetical protein n=1 Tax=Hartmannibacter diazotrophicus TaxID=1482074 RepID=UPI0012FDE0B8|nr:hypothetical protein [Hartmannibacter diazotrophicus]